MMCSTGPIPADRMHPTLRDRAATLLSWVLAGALFLSVGWMAISPDDPAGAVSLLTRTGAAFSVLQLAGIAAVTAGLATVLSGRRRPDVGVVATSIGLGLLSIQGDTSAYFFLSQSAGIPTDPAQLARRFAGESVVWMGVLGVAMMVSGFVAKWVPTTRQTCREEPDGDSAGDVQRSAASDIPGLQSMSQADAGLGPTPLGDGIKHTLIAAGIALVAYQVLSTGLQHRAIRHGQVCFAAAASFWLATRFAFQLVPVRSALWSLLAVGVAAVAAYLWASVRLGPTQWPSAVPGNHFLRSLPMQFVFFGAAAATMKSWSASPPRAAPNAAPERPPTKSKARERR